VSVASQLIEEVTAHAQNGSLEDAWEICADGTYFPNNLRTLWFQQHFIFGSMCNCSFCKFQSHTTEKQWTSTKL